MKGADTAKLGTWDKPVPTDPLQERINNELWEFKTFNVHPDYQSFSLEEHRLEDYQYGKGRNTAHIADPNAQSFFAPDSELLIKKTLGGRSKMQLYVHYYTN